MLEFPWFPYTMEEPATIDIDPKPIPDLISIAKIIEGTVNYVTFDNNVTTWDDYLNNLYTNSDLSVDELLMSKTEGIRYFCDKDLLVIANKVDNHVWDNQPTDFYGTASFYNLPANNKWGFEVVTELPDIFPKPTTAKLAKVVRDFKFITDIVVQYQNLPANLYTSMIVEEQGIMYDTTEGVYFTKTKNQQQLFDRINYIAENGISRPLNFLKYRRGYLPLEPEDQEDFLIARYLGLPSIPVAFIQSDKLIREFIIPRAENATIDGFPDYIIKKFPNDWDAEGLEELLRPYMGADLPETEENA